MPGFLLYIAWILTGLHICSPEIMNENLRFFEQKDFEQLTKGVAEIKSTEEGFVFNRYPDTVLAVLAGNRIWGIRSECTSGVSVHFSTDSPVLFVEGRIVVRMANLRCFFRCRQE